jgi:vacuolar protein sorting-associated protein VTA1
MPLTIPPEVKKITPYVRRAEELDRDKGNPESRLVSYYCRQYAVHTGISLATSPAGKGCLGELLGNLEAEKVIMDSFTRDESKFLCTKFADKIFDKADLEDRTAGANKNTARTFYAAASFLEILQQFHGDDDNSEEVEEQKKKSVYSKWKATEILKAIKDGRTPTPGGYGEDSNDVVADEDEQEEEVPKAVASDESVELTTLTPYVVETVSDDNDKEEEEETPMNVPTNGDDGGGDNDDDENSGDEEGTEVGLGPPPAYYPVGIEPVDPIMPPAPPMAPPKPPMTFNPTPPAPMDIPPPVPTNRLTPPKPKKISFLGGLVGSNNKKKNKKVGKVEIADATELTRFALAALDDKDADLAADRLQQALQILGR